MRIETEVFTDGGNKVRFDGSHLYYETEGGWLQVSWDETRELLEHFRAELEPGWDTVAKDTVTTTPIDDAAMDPGSPIEVRMEQQNHKDAFQYLKVQHDRGYAEINARDNTASIFKLPVKVVGDIIFHHYNRGEFPRWAS